MNAQEKSELDRAIKVAVAELRAHGGTAEQIEQLRRQFHDIYSENSEKPTDIQIPK